MKTSLGQRSLAFVLLTLLTWYPVEAQQGFPRQRETNPKYQEGDWISYSAARYITSIAVGRAFVYFGTRHSGIIRLDRYQYRWEFPWTTSNGLADNEIWAVAFDEESGYIWCASHRAISYYHPTAHKWRNSFKDEFGMSFGDEIESIGIGRDKVYFEARSGRTFESSKFGGIILTTAEHPGRNSETKWFGRKAQRRGDYPNFFMSDGYLFDPDGIVEDFNFRRGEIVTAVEDDWGNLWIGTWGLGAGRGDLRNQQLDMHAFGLASPSVNAMALIDEVLWVGGVTAVGPITGITSWDFRRERWTTYEQRDIAELRNDEIYAITPDKESLWFATGHGLAHYATRKSEWRSFDVFDGLSSNLVFDVAVDDSSVWIASDNGIDQLFKSSLGKKDSVKIRPVSPGNLGLTKVRDLELVENLLWAATNSGIYVFDTAKREGGFSAEFQGPITNRITSISRYANELWFGTAEGVEVFDIETREWLGSGEGRMISSKYINEIVATKNAAWAATNQGVMKFSRKDKNWRKFTVEDGLLDNRVNTIMLDGDYIWFGSESGLTQFFWNDPVRID